MFWHHPRMRPSSFVLALGLALLGCGDDEIDLTGSDYVAECDVQATISFESSDTAVVNRNNCEGYRLENWDYRIDGRDLTMAPEGRFGEPNVVHEEFRVSEDGEVLTYLGETSFIACGNCMSGETWTRQ
jgi:hypothetical protein